MLMRQPERLRFQIFFFASTAQQRHLTNLEFVGVVMMVHPAMHCLTLIIHPIFHVILLYSFFFFSFYDLFCFKRTVFIRMKACIQFLLNIQRF